MKYTDPNLRPPALSVLADRIPSTLKERQQWVLWAWVWNKERGEWSKPPRRLDGRNASSTDPKTWGRFDDVWDAYDLDLDHTWDGIGFVLTPDSGIVGVDFDDCLTSNGLEDWARAWVDQLQTYTERSPSGRGLRAFALGHLDGGRKKGGLEIYAAGRYLTCTGQTLSEQHSIEARDEVVQQLWASLAPAPPVQPAHNGDAPAALLLDDQALLEKARKAKNGRDFEALWTGDFARYPSQSEADLALASSLLFWTSGDAIRVDRLFRSSGLMRPKWDQRSGAQTYGERTISSALAKGGEVYSPPAARTSERPHPQIPQTPPDTAESETQAPAGAATWLTPLDAWLDNEEQIDWMIDNLLIRGGLGVLGAKPKVGKTTLLHQLALAVARGVPFLGRRTMQGPVIYLAMEESRGRVIERFRALGGKRGDPIHLLVGPAPEAALTRLWSAVRELGATLAIVDPIQRLTRLEDVNDYAQVSNATDPFIALARETGCAVVFSHHLGKFDRDSGDQLLGSTALFGSVDTAIILRRREGEPVRTIETIQRYGDSWAPTVLGHSPATGASWPMGVAEQYEQRLNCQAVLRILSDHGAPMPHRDLLELTGLRWQTTMRAVEQLIAGGLVGRSGGGVKGSRFTYLLTPLGAEEIDSLPVPVGLVAKYESGGLGNAGNESGNEFSVSQYATDVLPPKGGGKHILPTSSTPSVRLRRDGDIWQVLGVDGEPLGVGLFATQEAAFRWAQGEGLLVIEEVAS